MSVAVELEQMLKELEASKALPVISLGLERMLACLERLGNPHKRLPPVIHVAGTNGKGSTIAFLRAMCETAGKKVHVYTSPHLVRFNERIVLAGHEIDDAALLDALKRVKKAAGEMPLTFFEATTLAAFVAFADMPADILLLEVGLGGRLDATNVIEHPLACIITPIDYDHKEYLGETLAEIAAEKAGIIKPGSSVIISPQLAEARNVIEDHIERMKVSAWYVGAEALPSVHLSLVGEHQLLNAACASLAAREVLGLPEKAIEAGLAQAHWPARLQHLQKGPLSREGIDLWLDGGHNPAAAQALAVWVKQQPMPGLVVGMLKRKDAEGFFKPFAKMGLPIATVSLAEMGGFDAGELEVEARRAGCDKAKAFSSVQAASEWLISERCRTILIVGSLYLAGRILENHA